MVNLNAVPGIALTMVLVAAIFVGGFLVLDGLDDDLTANSAAANATTDITSAMENITDYAPTWGTIIGVAVLLGIVIAGFAFGRSRF